MPRREVYLSDSSSNNTHSVPGTTVRYLVELRQVSGDCVHGYVWILETEALALDSNPGHPRLRDVELPHPCIKCVQLTVVAIGRRSVILLLAILACAGPQQ